MVERINPKVVDEGDGCFTLVADSAEEVARLREILGPSPCGLGIVYEDPGPLEEAAEVEEPQAAGLCCPLDGEPWKDSPCEKLTGWSEEEAVQELAKHALLTDLKQLHDEGVF